MESGLTFEFTRIGFYEKNWNVLLIKGMKIGQQKYGYYNIQINVIKRVIAEGILTSIEHSLMRFFALQNIAMSI